MVTELRTGDEDDGIEIIGGVDPQIMAIAVRQMMTTTPTHAR